MIPVASIITLSPLVLTASCGPSHLWPATLVEGLYQAPGEAPEMLLEEIRGTEDVTTARRQRAGVRIDESKPLQDRILGKRANRDIDVADFRYLVGMFELAPAPDDNVSFMHLERKFMHLGLQIYDVGFQPPKFEAARPRVEATAFLPALVILLLNFTAIGIRDRLRERYKTLES